MEKPQPEFIDYALTVWQPRRVQPLTAEDARQICENIAGFFTILAEWSQDQLARQSKDFDQRRRAPMNAADSTKSFGVKSCDSRLKTLPNPVSSLIENSSRTESTLGRASAARGRPETTK